MINVNEEKAKVSIMKKLIVDINDEISSLDKYISDTSNLFSGTEADQYVVELIDHAKKTDIVAQILSNQVYIIDGVIDKVYQEQLEKRRLEERQSMERENDTFQVENT